MDTMRARKLAAYREGVAALDAKRSELEAWQAEAAFVVSQGFTNALDALDAVARSAAGARVAVKALGEHRARLVALAVELGQPAPEPVDDPLGFVERTLSDRPRLVALWRAVVDGRLAILIGAGES